MMIVNNERQARNLHGKRTGSSKKMAQFGLIKFLARYGLVVKVAAYGVYEPGFDSSSLKLFGMSTFR